MFLREKENLLHLPTLWYDERQEKGVFPWGKRSFQQLVDIWEKRKDRWHSYWVFLLKLYKALSRGGGISPSILNVRSFFF